MSVALPTPLSLPPGRPDGATTKPLNVAGPDLAPRGALHERGPGRMALGYSFFVTSDDEHVARAAQDMFDDLEPADHPAHTFHIASGHIESGHIASRHIASGHSAPGPDRSFSVWADGVMTAEHVSRGVALGTLVWLVNQGVILDPKRLVLFHAAAVAAGDEGVLLPAPPGCGKSTLAAALVASGLSYLSDEAGALDLASGRLLAYPKPISLGSGAMAVLSALGMAPGGPAADGASEEEEVQLAAAAIRPGSVAPSCTVRSIVFPELALGESTALHRLRPMEALARLVPNTFNLAQRPQEHLEACAELCRRAEAYRLVVGDLASACGAVLDLGRSAGGVHPDVQVAR